MRGTALWWSSWKNIGDNILQSLDAVGTDQAYPFYTPLVKFIQHLAPATGTFCRFVENARNFPHLILLYRKNDIEGFRIHASAAVNLDI